jgi:hypothetical protein
LNTSVLLAAAVAVGVMLAAAVQVACLQVIQMSMLQA